MQLSQRLKAAIKDVPDFPKAGILFKDIMPVFADPQLCKAITEHIADRFPNIDAIAGIESRGFFWGMNVAQQLGIPFIPVRKAGKLPRKTIQQEYALEYGTATIEIQEDAIKKAWRVLVHDDLLATGGTASATASLINQVGHCIGFSFLVELSFLDGRAKLASFGAEIDSIISY